MIEFNSDGSLKLPENIARIKEEHINKLKHQKCIKIRREIVNFKAPKKCVLYITLSDAIDDSRFISSLYMYFNQKAQTPSALRKIDDKNFEIEIGTDYRRCTDCNSLINKYREFLCSNMIEERGGCTYEGRKNFVYEDYF
jgi:hypothetical protein